MTKPQTRKFQGLQILRMVAACLVLVTHSTFYTSERLGLGHGHRVWTRGGVGVDLFFVLSGFVMIASSEKLLADPAGWRIFAERRIVRIVPMYYLITTIKLTIMLATTGLVLHAVLNPAKAVFSYLFLPTYNADGQIQPIVGVGWTLNFEMFFYLLFTLALFFKTNIFKSLGVALFLLALGAYVRRPWWPPAAFYCDTIVLEFFLGMLIARLYMKERFLPVRVAWALLVVGSAGLFFIPNALDSVSRGLLAGIPAALILWGMTGLEQVLTRVPRLVFFLADASYIIYLAHPLVAPAPAVIMAKLHVSYPTLAAVLAFLLCLLFGSLLHIVVERPITEWLRNRLTIRHKKFIHVT